MAFEAQLQNLRTAKEKWLAVLVDPDKVEPGHDLDQLAQAIQATADVVFVGGSLMSTHHLDAILKTIRANCNLPLVLFPGSGHQLSAEADALLFLSLISGRNAELLIGEHVRTAQTIKKMGLSTVATGYMLVESGTCTTAQYISQTQPIPRKKDDIAVATALAGEMLGLKCIYMDGGSGAELPVPTSMIHSVSVSVNLPLIVGGGIRSSQAAKAAWNAGADIIVIGTAIENDPSFLLELGRIKRALSVHP